MVPIKGVVVRIPDSKWRKVLPVLENLSRKTGSNFGSMMPLRIVKRVREATVIPESLGTGEHIREFMLPGPDYTRFQNAVSHLDVSDIQVIDNVPIPGTDHDVPKGPISEGPKDVPTRLLNYNYPMPRD